MSDEELRELGAELSNGAQALLFNAPDDAQIYDYTMSFAIQLRDRKLVDEYWTWVSSTRPGIQRTPLGREVARALKTASRKLA